MGIPQGATPFKKALRGVGVSAATVRISDSRVVAGRQRIYTRVVIENETSSNTIARVGVVTPDGFYLYHYFATFATDIPQVLTDLALPVDTWEQLAVDFIGSTTGDVLTVYLVGYEQDTKPQ